MLLLSNAVALACGSTASHPDGNAGASGAGTGGNAVTGAGTAAGGSATTGGSASKGGMGGVPLAGSSGNTSGGSLGGTSAGSESTAGASGSAGKAPMERALCTVDAKQVCVVSLVASKADSDAACVGEDGGTVVANCPSKDLLGCCALLEGRVTDCFYAGNTNGITKAMCLEVGGTWTDTPPP